MIFAICPKCFAREALERARATMAQMKDDKTRSDRWAFGFGSLSGTLEMLTESRLKLCGTHASEVRSADDPKRVCPSCGAAHARWALCAVADGSETL